MTHVLEPAIIESGDLEERERGKKTKKNIIKIFSDFKLQRTRPEGRPDSDQQMKTTGEKHAHIG